ncbi:unnamed protein product [Rotaria socialis]|uniref:GOLD domain-containing protein n=1 Tax=Rotaria socialis TaxID=392032 RepID=A0A820R2T9_9BILA|nr:unnamed protein product [Rotaria socialis]
MGDYYIILSIELAFEIFLIESGTKEQNYQRYREERFRTLSETTNQRVLWWSLAQLVILVIAGFWQMRHLRGFFEAKKLV